MVPAPHVRISLVWKEISRVAGKEIIRYEPTGYDRWRDASRPRRRDERSWRRGDRVACGRQILRAHPQPRPDRAASTTGSQRGHDKPRYGFSLPRGSRPRRMGHPQTRTPTGSPPNNENLTTIVPVRFLHSIVDTELLSTLIPDHSFRRHHAARSWKGLRP